MPLWNTILPKQLQFEWHLEKVAQNGMFTSSWKKNGNFLLWKHASLY